MVSSQRWNASGYSDRRGDFLLPLPQYRPDLSFEEAVLCNMRMSGIIRGRTASPTEMKDDLTGYGLPHLAHDSVGCVDTSNMKGLLLIA